MSGMYTNDSRCLTVTTFMQDSTIRKSSDTSSTSEALGCAVNYMMPEQTSIYQSISTFFVLENLDYLQCMDETQSVRFNNSISQTA